MRAAEKKAFFDKVKALRREKTYAEVVQLLGPPYSQEAISAKEHDRPLGTCLCYYVRKLSDGVNEKYDQSVDLNFDNGNNLASVGLQNLTDLCEQLNDLPVTATRWNDLTKEIDVTVKQGDKRGNGRGDTESAGQNRQGVSDERAVRERASDPPRP